MKRLNLDDPQVWNKWRELYYDLTQEENVQFGYDIFARFPRQNSFNPIPFCNEIVRAFNSRSPTPLKVLEIGGWRGELALHCLKLNYPIHSWLNLDVCKAAVENTLKALNRFPYQPVVPDDFRWWKRTGQPVGKFNLCMSAHTIEHLSNNDLKDLLRTLAGIPTIIFEAPISEGGQTWHDYQGTHILEMGWRELSIEMGKLGYMNRKLTDWCYAYDFFGSSK